ncbi:MAG: cupin domain-containing protein [Clostridiales bacterium]|nr:cupin domain-containing protein [Clostridiales bacterium]
MNIGEKIKHLRIKNGLTQQELANRCELSKGFISQVERDLTSPSIATLIDILECLGSNLKDFFSENDDEKIVFHKSDIFIQEDKELGHAIQWIVPNSQKNSMEPILMQIQPGGASELDDPHDGEEFGYIISGTIFLHLGNQKLKVKKGESFYFKPSLVHFISNESKYTATVLWVSSPPSF